MTGEFPAQRASNADNVPFDDVIIENDYLKQLKHKLNVVQMQSNFFHFFFN